MYKRHSSRDSARARDSETLHLRKRSCGARQLLYIRYFSGLRCVRRFLGTDETRTKDRARHRASPLLPSPPPPKELSTCQERMIGAIRVELAPMVFRTSTTKSSATPPMPCPRGEPVPDFRWILETLRQNSQGQVGEEIGKLKVVTDLQPEHQANAATRLKRNSLRCVFL